MSAFFTSGRAIDVVLAVLAIELLVLQRRYRRHRRGLSPLDLVGQMLPGGLLLLALRCALTGADYRWIAALLCASFPAHLFDLVRRSRAHAMLARRRENADATELGRTPFSGSVPARSQYVN